MERKRITCPETCQLALIDLERTPLGIVIAGCSRSSPGSELACTRECAKRMDRRDRRGVDDRDRVLIVLAGQHPRAAQLAEHLAGALRLDALEVELAVLDAGAPPPLPDYDAVAIVASVTLRRHANQLAAYVHEHADGLPSMPAFLFVTGGDQRDAEHWIARMFLRTAWAPTATFVDNAALSFGAAVGPLAQRISEELPARAPLPPSG